MQKHIATIIALTVSLAVCSQPDTNTRSRLSNYFSNYQNTEYHNSEAIRLQDVTYDTLSHRIILTANEPFLGQPFRTPIVQKIYSDLRKLLPPPYNEWEITVMVNKEPIQQLVPVSELHWPADSLRLWRGIEYNSNPWVSNIDQHYQTSEGLSGRHLFLWASHGRYYNQNNHTWEWQRPRLFGTCEDLFTQSIVIPFLIPMLENAGAIIYSPRERDWQTNEIIVDNDKPAGSYIETNSTLPWLDGGTGFSHTRDIYHDKENPFTDGTCRMAAAQQSTDSLSTARWIPLIPEDGEYAVYVSYRTYPNSIPDAHYTVIHGGKSTRFIVNQQMGGATWVYLGTFHFTKGSNPQNSVLLTSESSVGGIVTADAVRFGGGIGKSGLPRYLEGARYYMQWAGAPYSVYGTKQSQNQYGEDINARSHGVNYLARGSVYMPSDTDTIPGLKVPIDLSLAIHSDAGTRPGRNIVGSLGIYTTGFHEGKLATGLSRLMSRDFADQMLTQIQTDMQHHFPLWQRRALYDRNYSESREPQIPSMILETMSHQNFADMIIGHDPIGKFILARATYKGILRYEATAHGIRQYTVQPLPVHSLKAISHPETSSITLSWKPRKDVYEPSSTPTSYIIYTATDNNGWDNGQSLTQTSASIRINPGTLYRFKVTAANSGGQSMPSAEVCATVSSTPSAKLLLINAFNRVASAQVSDNDSLRGFDFNADPGVPYIKDASRYDLNGAVTAGNTFDYTTMHASDLLQTDSLGHITRQLNISSCTSDALTDIDLKYYEILDIIFGAQRNDGYSYLKYQTFTPTLMEKLHRYTRSGGNLLLSGAYIGEENKTVETEQFASMVLKYRFDTAIPTDSLQIGGMGTSFNLYSQPNRQLYYTTRVNALQPLDGAYSTLLYTSRQNNDTIQTSAAIAYNGKDYRSICYGFPLETIQNPLIRRSIINASYNFLKR